jgi:hypothetical protein
MEVDHPKKEQAPATAQSARQSDVNDDWHKMRSAQYRPEQLPAQDPLT